MTLTADRKDFVDPDTCCHRCVMNGNNRALSSGVAFFLKHDDGTEHPYGPHCAAETLGGREALKGIPDFTARESDQLGGGESGGGTGGSDGPDPQDAALRDAAIAKRYLLLRMEKVANIPGINPMVRYQPLQTIYQEFRKTGILDPADVTHILAIERKATTPTNLRTINLLDVYTAETKLTRRIKQSTTPKDKTYLEGIRSWLRAKLRLSAKQIASAKIQLHPSAFDN
ncbi:hypothetical protein OKW30_005479 [Paraburkholderia sp. Clong3]|uniref:hypothetical protein n=1 Tax=unclassified Paraburkholderia TaxID=2615204 RepID=UPI0016562519|nr:MULTISPECIES: hypothetical protein [unclassified Paraburkholderia]MBC8733152.1 hypothetical protein [Paraburkholderia sp. UCT2]MBC8742102.1 hypothetical protein [Paraburkholderia sp. UCT31]